MLIQFEVYIIMKKFDKEYSTQYVAEKEFLKSHGIYPTFVKMICGVTTFKYEKNSKLFQVLSLFYK